MSFLDFDLSNLNTSTVLFSLIKVLSFPGYIFSVIFSPFLLISEYCFDSFEVSVYLPVSLEDNLKSCCVFELSNLNTSTFLFSLIKVLFFPGNIFSVIFSPAFLIWLYCLESFELPLYLSISDEPIFIPFFAVCWLIFFTSPFLRSLSIVVNILSLIFSPLGNSEYCCFDFILSSYFFETLDSTFASFCGLGRFILKTSTFLVSIINLLFFPGYIFSVIFSACFMKVVRSIVFGNFVDFDLNFADLSIFLEILPFLLFKFLSIYLHHLSIIIILLISCFEAYAHFFMLKFPDFPIAKWPPFLLIGLSEVSYLFLKAFCCSKDLYLEFTFFPTELVSLKLTLEFWATLFFDI